MLNSRQTTQQAGRITTVSGVQPRIVSWFMLLLLTTLLMTACVHAAPPTRSASPVPLPRVQRGMASWYGKKFHGRKTASGERYDMFKLTAAHQRAPLGTYALVTNIATGRSVRVRINDRGPFAKGRIIDLSRAAAQQLGMLTAGVARVRVEFLPHTRPQPRYIVQVGAYSDSSNAARVQHRLTKQYSQVWVSKTNGTSPPLYRVRLGPFTSRVQAERVALRVRALGYSTGVVPMP